MKRVVCVLFVLSVVLPAMALEDFSNAFTPDSHTRGLWHFDQSSGNTILVDSGPYANDGELQIGFTDELDPDTTWQASKTGFGNCAVAWWNSSTDLNKGTIRVSQPAYPGFVSLGFNGREDLTIEFLIYPFSTSGTSIIIAMYTGGNYSVSLSEGNLKYGWYNNGWQSVQDTTTIPTNMWTHVAIIQDRSQFYGQNKSITYFFINGVESSMHVATSNGVGGWDRESVYIMGNSSGAQNFLGKLDELRISDCIRNYGDLNPPQPLEIEPVLWYKPYDGTDTYTIVLLHMNETSGTTLDDAAPAGGDNDGTLASGNISARTSTNVPSALYDRSLSFDGTANDQVNISDTDALDMKYHLTIEAWVYPTKLGSGWTRGIVSKPYAYELIFAYRMLRGAVHDGSKYYPVWTSGNMAAAPLYEWTHVAMTYDFWWEGGDTPSHLIGNHVRLFINGEEGPYHESYGGPYNGPIFPSTAPVMLGYEDLKFTGDLDEVRISAASRILEMPILEINWIKRVSNDVQFEFNAVKNNIYMIRSTASMGSWEKLDGATGEFGVTLVTDSSGLLGAIKKFYRVEDFVPESMGYAEIQSKSPSVDGTLSEWTDTDVIATRDNFFETVSDWVRPLPYVQGDFYGAYNESDAAYYFAFNVKELSDSDNFDLMLSEPSDTTIVDQIRFDKDGQIEFNVFDSEIHTRWDTGEGDIYTGSDFVADGGAFASSKSGGMLKVEVKVPYSWIADGYSFPSSSQRTVHFNWESNETGLWDTAKQGTTNPKQLSWPVVAGSFDDPGVGVSRQ